MGIGLFSSNFWRAEIRGLSECARNHRIYLRPFVPFSQSLQLFPAVTQQGMAGQFQGGASRVNTPQASTQTSPMHVAESSPSVATVASFGLRAVAVGVGTRPKIKKILRDQHILEYTQHITTLEKYTSSPDPPSPPPPSPDPQWRTHQTTPQSPRGQQHQRRNRHTHQSLSQQRRHGNY